MGSAWKRYRWRSSKGSERVLTRDREVVAIGAPYSDSKGGYSGHVRVYKIKKIEQLPTA